MRVPSGQIPYWGYQVSDILKVYFILCTPKMSKSMIENQGWTISRIREPGYHIFLKFLLKPNASDFYIVGPRNQTKWISYKYFTRDCPFPNGEFNHEIYIKTYYVPWKCEILTKSTSHRSPHPYKFRLHCLHTDFLQKMHVLI